MSVFEYGTGGSTFFFAQRAKKVVSVEHYCDWYEKLKVHLSEARINNCELVLCPPEAPSVNKPGQIKEDYGSLHSEYRNISFEKYVKCIDHYADGDFDLVLVDGRSRVSCLFHAVQKIKINGYLMLDNSERAQYEEARIFLSRFDRTDFYGIGPYSSEKWQTSIWKIGTSRGAQQTGLL
jgi:hypothetical protein